MGGMNFTDSFVADGCAGDKGIPAVTLGAAVQWYGTLHVAWIRAQGFQLAALC